MNTRRALLKSLAALPVVSACATATVAARRNYTPSGLPLRRANISDDRVVRIVTGLRPFRPTGFVVRAERFDDKTVIHNYGHGGGGVTLSWGTAHLAADLARPSPQRRCAVLGCGAVGLATARLLQRYGREVTIYARDLPPETTSNIAGAQWSPASFYDRDAVDERFYERLAVAMRHAYREFQHLYGPRYGIRWVSNYYVSDRPMAKDDLRHHYAAMFPELADLAPDEHPFPARYATHFDTMFIEPPVYLPAVMRDFRDAGGTIVVREFRDVPDILALDEALIVNCTGLGSKALFGDDDLIPVKGQLVVLKPQDDLHYLMISDGIYMFPRTDGVLLGGTFERNEWSLVPDAAETRRILQSHRTFFRNMDDPWALPWTT